MNLTTLLDCLPVAGTDRHGWPWSEETSTALHADRQNWPRISIVTPSFNQAAFIEETIRSILLQNYPNLQYIVIDGGSTDGTVEILKKYAPWIDYWVSAPDDGQSDAINIGLERCNGEWFNWINSDDFLAPGALHALICTALVGSPVMVSGTTVNLRGSTRFSNYRTNILNDWPALLFSMQVNQPGSLLNLQSVRNAGNIRRDLDLVMDLDLWLRLVLRNGPDSFRQCEEEVAYYRYHDASKTCAEDDVFALEEFALLTDLLMSTGVLLPAGVLDVRARCKAATAEFVPATLSIDANQAEGAWLDRMVISDSLLFRALRKSLPLDHDPLPRFRRLLEELRPWIQRHHPRDVRNLIGRSILHAMQFLGSHSPVFAFRVLCLDPCPATARALIRLFIRP